MSGWIFGPCDLCGDHEGRDIFEFQHSDAPDQRAFVRQCSGCGLRRLWPRPGPDVIAGYYPSTVGAYSGRRRSGLKQAVWDLLRDGASGAPGRGRMLRPFGPIFRFAARRQFDINVPLSRDPLPRIIDIGCGFGDMLLYWKSRGADVLGVDLGEPAVQKGHELGLNILHGSLEQQELASGRFDVAVLNHSLEHMPNPEATLGEVARILRPGGQLHLAVPNGAGAGFARQRTGWEHCSFPLHLWFFDPGSLKRLLCVAGFTDVRIRTKNTWRRPFAFGRGDILSATARVAAKT